MDEDDEDDEVIVMAHWSMGLEGDHLFWSSSPENERMSPEN